VSLLRLRELQGYERSKVDKKVARGVLRYYLAEACLSPSRPGCSYDIDSSQQAPGAIAALMLSGGRASPLHRRLLACKPLGRTGSPLSPDVHSLCQPRVPREKRKQQGVVLRGQLVLGTTEEEPSEQVSLPALDSSSSLEQVLSHVLFWRCSPAAAFKTSALERCRRPFTRIRQTADATLAVFHPKDSLWRGLNWPAIPIDAAGPPLPNWYTICARSRGPFLQHLD